MALEDFIRESNAIEGIHRDPTNAEIKAHRLLLSLEELTVSDVASFVTAVAGAPIRSKQGMHVRVGKHIPPPGGPRIVESLDILLSNISTGFDRPYAAHQKYEGLHPFMDGNGRSGRVIWLWHMAFMNNVAHEEVIKHIGFLHQWYYQSLDNYRE